MVWGGGAMVWGGGAKVWGGGAKVWEEGQRCGEEGEGGPVMGFVLLHVHRFWLDDHHSHVHTYQYSVIGTPLMRLK